MEDHRNQSDTDALLEELLRETAGDSPEPEDAPESESLPENPDRAEEESAGEGASAPEERMEKTQSFQTVAHPHAGKAAGEQGKRSPEHPRQHPASGSTASRRKKQARPSSGRSKEHAPEKKRRRRTNLPFVLVWTTIIVAISVVLSVGLLAIGKDMYAVDKDSTEKIINVPENASTEQIAQMLYDEEIIRIPKMYRLVSKLNGSDGTYVAGEHVVSASMSYETLISTLTKPVKAETVRVTFPEGITMLDAAKLLEENKVCEASRFIYFFNIADYNYDIFKKMPKSNELKFYQHEGYLFPDTYEFYVGMDPELVCQKIFMRTNEILSEGKLKDLDMTYYERMEELDISLDELITLASMIQREASSVSSMKLVSSVFWNRLEDSEQFPRLQSDPTSKYVENVIKPNISVANDAIYEAYDTYKCIGLPAGAICNPGVDAIEAALDPTSSAFYYFCANVETGEIFYAKTDEEHEANLQAIQNHTQPGDNLDAEAGQERPDEDNDEQ
ncbi:endolytic transglycosylase MltG [Ruminococcus sp.]|uniref:endolytic transglycosylase MltG n=1 Tax=Ruminococcus sp. TaxID=41978 RepID=UPI003F08E382